ncbi:polysaccharide pyruvyl transferase family protein [Cereibacter sp. SYSU M97828]|nr:polysaccharide pyruvyl transferase family protein [Cereibacter flavus]
MDLFHYEIQSGNFGDDLNLWLWDEILPGWREMRPGTVLVGVGTLLNNKLPRGRRKLVLGSGVGYGDLPDPALMAECEFLSVRGPRSAKALGLPESRGIIDPAMLIADIPAFRGIAKSGPAIFIPHHDSTHRADWARLCAKAGIAYVSPEGEAREVIRRIAAAPLVITESMHGAILADAFGTPWLPVIISHRFNDWKWQDWAGSLGMTLDIPSLFPLTQRLARLLPRQQRKPALPTAARSSAPAKPHTPSTRHKLRLALESMQAEGRLRSLATQPGLLSDRKALNEAKTRYRAMLAELREKAVA